MDPISKHEAILLRAIRGTDGWVAPDTLFQLFKHGMGLDGSRTAGVQPLLDQVVDSLVPKAYVQVEQRGSVRFVRITPRGELKISEGK